MERVERPSAEALLAELGFVPRLTIYLAGAPGAGKTHRLLGDAAMQAAAGRRVAIGWIETKDRPGLEASAARFARIAPRTFSSAGATYTDFDLEAALASDAETIVLDELAHSNPPGAPNAKRWQDALALRTAGKSVLGAFNVQHLETVAPVAERIIGHPIREIVPLSFLKSADGVIALDVSASVLESRLRSGRIVRLDDVERAAMGLFAPRNLQLMRELLLRTVDALTVPVMSPGKTSTALAIVAGDADPRAYLRRMGALAEALDLALEVTRIGERGDADVEETVRGIDGVMIAPPSKLDRGDLANVRAAFVCVPAGEMANRLLAHPVDRDVYVADPGRAPLADGVAGARHPYGQTAGDRLRIGYGRLTIYLGSAAGSGKTFAMLDRAHTMLEEGVDVVGAVIETHGREDTQAKAAGIPVLPRRPDGELDPHAVLARRPSVVLVDELAHTNAADGPYRKRYDDVIAILREGIDVMTTLNVQHLEGLGDAVERLTGTRVRETLPDAILELADDVIFIDVTPDVLRERLRDGKIYGRERIDAALTNFFRAENLAALRELTVRELMHARSERRAAPPFSRIVLGVAARVRDVGLIERMGRFAARLDVDLLVVHVAVPGAVPDPVAIDALANAAKLAKGRWRIVEDSQPAAALASLATAVDVVVVESPRRERRPLGPPSFARRAIRAGIAELLVLVAR